jgi:hypothetical protein
MGECRGRVSRGSVKGECQGRVSRESVKGECQGRVSRESVKGECRGSRGRCSQAERGAWTVFVGVSGRTLALVCVTARVRELTDARSAVVLPLARVDVARVVPDHAVAVAHEVETVERGAVEAARGRQLRLRIPW